jgi:hypothetical protein
MRTLCIGQVEDRTNIDQQILKQTVQPDRVILLVDENPAPDISDDDAIVLRRKRIVENHKKLVDIVKAYSEYDLIWQVEGDCIFKDDTFHLLLESYRQRHTPMTGYISGVQVGRHGIFALGAWRFPGDRLAFESLDHKLTGIQEVDATGFYCLLASREVWLKGNCTWDGERWGPDINWGLSLREQGYTLYANLDIPIGHRVARGELWPHQSRRWQMEIQSQLSPS